MKKLLPILLIIPLIVGGFFSFDAPRASAAATFVTWNPADKGTTTTLSSGNLTTSQTGTNGARATLGKSSGKWYWEITITSGINAVFGVGTSVAGLTTYPGGDAAGAGYYQYNGNFITGGSSTAYGTSATTGDVIGVALDVGGGTITFYKNNVSQGTNAISIGAGAVYPMIGSAGSVGVVDFANFGATTLSYSPPAGYQSIGLSMSGECTGGVITRSGGYTIHTFTNSGTLTCTSSGTANYLVVAGGGGGGGGSSGGGVGGAGGGAGGMLTGTASVSAQSYTITIGDGGPGGTGGAHGTAGNGSSALGISTTGGGYGGTYQGAVGPGGNGGSGGGGSYANGGTGVAGQGNAGGNGVAGPPYLGSGGGAGAAGATAAAGGVGLASSISGASTYYAGGGGNGGGGGSETTAGGNGGGGNGDGGNGTVNTGGGGAGGTYGAGAGGNGGSGIVIVSYLTPAPAAPTVTTQAATNSGQTAATLNGNITNTGSSNATVRGFAYGTSATLSTVIATTTENGSFSTGAFTGPIYGLNANTTYYFRPYATNSTGTSFGTITSFVTASIVYAPAYAKFKFAGGYTKFKGGAIKYGISLPISCTGGTVTYRGGYEVHTFFSNGSFICTGTGTVNYLVVAGGGAGSYGSGAGGAGGMRTGTLSVTPQAYPITVGDGGVGSASQVNGANGGNSIFSTITSTGGGGGAVWGGTGNNGGSGGGGSSQASSPGGTGIAGQGNNGGTYSVGNYAPGGGGAAAVGVSTGAGGAGLTSSISGASVYYAGGGGGGWYPGPGAGGAGGTGGGGAGGGYAGIAPVAGTANTGGGGGGGYYQTGASGGSGIVIISYPIASSPSYATWNPSDKNVSVTLSNGNLTAAASFSNQSVRATLGKSSGKWYWEYSPNSGNGMMGIGTSAVPTSQSPGTTANGWGYYGPGQIYNNNANTATVASYTGGDVLGYGLDLDNNKLSFYKNNTLQNISTITAGTWYPMYGLGSSNSDSTIANFGATALTYPPPNGTFFNPKDAGSGIVTSNNNLTFNVASSNFGVRSNTSKSSGKWYAEFRILGGIYNELGVAKSTASLATSPDSAGALLAYTYYQSGGYYYGTNVGTGTGASYTTGDVVGIALDLTTGTVTSYKNGVAQDVMGTGLTGSWYLIAGAWSASGNATLNTGATNFAYTPPTGYSAWDSTVYASGVYQ